MTKNEAYKNKLVSRSELINRIYDDFQDELEELENRRCESCIGYVDFDYCKTIDDDCRLIVTLCNGCNKYEPKEIK